MNSFYGLVNEMVADRHREYLHEAEQRRRIRQAAAPGDRWTHAFVTRLRSTLTRDTSRRERHIVPAVPSRLIGV